MITEYLFAASRLPRGIVVRIDFAYGSVHWVSRTSASSRSSTRRCRQPSLRRLGSVSGVLSTLNIRSIIGNRGALDSLSSKEYQPGSTLPNPVSW